MATRLSTSQNKKASCFEMLPMAPDLSFGRSYSMGNGTETWDLECEGFLWTTVSTTDWRTGIWNVRSFYRLYSLEWRISIDSRHYNESIRPHDLHSNNTLKLAAFYTTTLRKKYFIFSLFQLIFEWRRTFNPLSQVEFWKVTRHFCTQNRLKFHVLIFIKWVLQEIWSLHYFSLHLPTIFFYIREFVYWRKRRSRYIFLDQPYTIYRQDKRGKIFRQIKPSSEL